MLCPNCGARILHYSKNTVYDDGSQKRFCSRFCLNEWNDAKNLARKYQQKKEKEFREQKGIDRWIK
jgi:hypothetical protein